MNSEKPPPEDFFPGWLEETLRINGVSEIPRLLYKFSSCDSKYFRFAALELLLHSRIRLSSSSEFNDPFEHAFVIDAASTEQGKEFLKGICKRQGLRPLPEEELSSIVADADDFTEKTRSNFRSILETAGIYSLSATIRNPLMWAHYACAHRGMAFVFRLAMMPSIGAMPVRYQAHIHRFALGDYDGPPASILIKGSDWKYELEWRIVEARMAKQWKLIDPGSLFGVVFGSRCGEEDSDFILELSRRRKDAGLPALRVFRAGIDQHKFELDLFRLGKNGWEVATDLA